MAHAQAIWYRKHAISFGDNQGSRDNKHSYFGSALYDQVWRAPMAITCFWKMSIPLHSFHLIWRKPAGMRSARSFPNGQLPNGMNSLLRWGGWDVHTRRKQKKPIRLQSWTANCAPAVNIDNGSDSLFILLDFAAGRWCYCKLSTNISSYHQHAEDWSIWGIEKKLNSLNSNQLSGGAALVGSGLNYSHSWIRFTIHCKVDLGEGRLHAPDGRWWCVSFIL